MINFLLHKNSEKTNMANLFRDMNMKKTFAVNWKLLQHPVQSISSLFLIERMGNVHLKKLLLLLIRSYKADRICCTTVKNGFMEIVFQWKKMLSEQKHVS